MRNVMTLSRRSWRVAAYCILIPAIALAAFWYRSRLSRDPFLIEAGSARSPVLSFLNFSYFYNRSLLQSVAGHNAQAEQFQRQALLSLKRRLAGGDATTPWRLAEQLFGGLPDDSANNLSPEAVARSIFPDWLHGTLGHREMAMLAAETGRALLALRLLDRAVEADSKDLLSLYLSARLSYQTDSGKSASIARFKTLDPLLQNPAIASRLGARQRAAMIASVCYFLGRDAYEHRDSSRAAAYLERSIAQAPSYLPAHQLLHEIRQARTAGELAGWTRNLAALAPDVATNLKMQDRELLGYSHEPLENSLQNRFWITLFWRLPSAGAGISLASVNGSIQYRQGSLLIETREATNLVRNGFFDETPLSNNDSIFGWPIGVYNREGTLRTVAHDPEARSFVASIENREAATSGLESEPIRVEAGQALLLAGRMVSRGGLGNAGISWIDAAGKYLGYDVAISEYTTNSWSERAGIVAPPPEADHARIRLSNQFKQGTVKFDDVILTPLEPVRRTEGK